MTRLTFHYQWVQTGKGSKARYTCHEAYSSKDGLYALNPIPSEPDDPDMEAAMETDLEKYGVVDFKAIRPLIDRYTEDMEMPLFAEATYPYYEDVEDIIIEDDGYDHKGNIIDLVDYMKRNR